MDARNKRFYDALAVACPLAPTPAHSSRRATLGTLRVASATAAVVPSSQAIVSRICVSRIQTIGAMRNAGARGARPTPCLIARCAQVGYLSGDFA